MDMQISGALSKSPLGILLRNGYIGSNGNSGFDFVRHLHIDFHSS